MSRLPGPQRNFTQVPHVLYETGISAEAIALYGLLGKWAWSSKDKQGACFVGYETLATAMRCSTRSIERWVGQLESVDAISVRRKRGHHKKNVVTFLPFDAILTQPRYALPDPTALSGLDEDDEDFRPDSPVAPEPTRPDSPVAPEASDPTDVSPRPDSGVASQGKQTNESDSLEQADELKQEADELKPQSQSARERPPLAIEFDEYGIAFGSAYPSASHQVISQGVGRLIDSRGVEAAQVVVHGWIEALADPGPVFAKFVELVAS